LSNKKAAKYDRRLIEYKRQISELQGLIRQQDWYIKVLSTELSTIHRLYQQQNNQMQTSPQFPENTETILESSLGLQSLD
jgi:hypothetical protein